MVVSNEAAEIRPVVDVLKGNNRDILLVKERCRGLDSQQEQLLIRSRRGYGFLADAFTETEEYPLQLGHWLALWPTLKELFPGTNDGDIYHKRVIATTIAAAHSIEGLEGPNWKRLPKYYLEMTQLPKELLNDARGLQYIADRLELVRSSVVESKELERIQGFRFREDNIYEEIWHHAIGNGVVNLLQIVRSAIEL